MNTFNLFVGCEEVYNEDYSAIVQEIFEEEKKAELKKRIAKLEEKQKQFKTKEIFGVVLPNDETLLFDNEKSLSSYLWLEYQKELINCGETTYQYPFSCYKGCCEFFTKIVIE